MKHSNTKKALLGSALSVLLCLSMLIGSTFAWFTDTASTGVNTIVSGDLDIELQMQDETGEWVKAEGETLNWVKAADAADNEPILWEPGCTYQLQPVKIVNVGNLALKFQAVVNGAKGDLELLDVIDFTYDGVELGQYISLLPGEEKILTITGYMQETAGNKYMNKTVSDIAISVSATQDTVEYDSIDNQYDKDAVIYPAGVTNETFATENAVAVDGEGKYFANFEAALNAAADGSVIYLKENSTLPKVKEDHPNLAKDLTIYGNGSDFKGLEYSIGTYTDPTGSETTITIYNAKNIKVWGQPSQKGFVYNVKLVNCHNDGVGMVMYRMDELAKDKIHVEMLDCSVKNTTDGVHTTAVGSILVKNCVFEDCGVPVNVATKQDGEITVRVENCQFIRCGRVNEADDYFAPVRFVNNSNNATVTGTVVNSVFTDTVGHNGDILLGDYRPGKNTKMVTCHIETTSPVMVKNSAEDPFAFTGGTVTLA